MPECKKNGCDNVGVNPLSLTHLIYTEIDTERLGFLCESHTVEASKFKKTDTRGLKEWLHTPLANL